jgi:hypothetical protein
MSMDWSVELLYWFNTALPGVMGAAVLLARRWRHLRWFPFYALLVFFMNVLYLSWLYNYPFYWIKHLTGELLALGVVVEVLRKEANKRPIWPWFALVSLATVYFLPIDQNLKSYLPQEIFAIGLALELPTALRVKSAPLLAWAMIGSATVVSDLIKFVSPWPKIHEIMRVLDPMFFTIFGIILLAGIFWPELSTVGKKAAVFLSSLPWGPKPIKVVEETNSSSRPGGPGNLASFPSRPSAPLEGKQGFGVEQISQDKKLELISQKLDALGAAVEAAAVLSISLKKPFLSPQDLALYLGVDVETARRFVEQRGIAKIHLTDSADEWVVFRADIDSALGEE